MMIAPVDPLLVWIARAALAVLLAHAALAKLADRPLFEQHMAAYRLPHPLLPALAWALPLLELAAAALLLTPWRMAGALLAGALLLIYGAGMALALAQGRELDCGCGGEPLPVSWALVARNAVLASVAGFAAWPAAARALGWQDFLVVAAAVLLATLLYAALNQVLRHQAGLRARRPTLWRT
jgi:Methylamine utilisation protein MauE